jgi:hypothetical protein
MTVTTKMAATRSGSRRRSAPNGVIILRGDGGERQSQLEHGIEDQVGKDKIWIRLPKWFVDRFEQ